MSWEEINSDKRFFSEIFTRLLNQAHVAHQCTSGYKVQFNRGMISAYASMIIDAVLITRAIYSNI